MARRTFHCERMKEADFFQFAVFMTYVILPIALPIPDIVETSMCFNNTQCPAGYHKAVAEISTKCQSSEIYCAPCTEGTFTDAFNTLRQCFPHRSCNFNAKILRPGTKTEDTICQCIDHAYLSVSGDCVLWRKCGKGERVAITGNSTHNVVCGECPDGTFSDTKDWSTSCQNHTRCEECGLKTVTKGSRSHDTICESDCKNVLYSKSAGTTIPAVSHIEDAFSIHSNEEISTGDYTSVTTKSTESEHNGWGDRNIITIIMVLILLGLAAVCAGLCVYCKICRRHDSMRKDRGVARCNGTQNHNWHNGHAYEPVQNGVQNGWPNGETYPIPQITNVNVNVIGVTNLQQSNVGGTHQTDVEESGQTPINEEVIKRDVKGHKTLAKGIAESGESTNGIPETSAPEDKWHDSPIVTECTDDPKQNTEDSYDKEANLNEGGQYTLRQDSSMTGHSSDQDSDDDTVNTKMLSVG